MKKSPQRPARPPYAALAVVAVAVLLVVGLVAINNRLAAHDTGADAPRPVGTPLVDGTTVGAARLPPGDQTGGGAGQPVDGISCSGGEMVAVHTHAHVSIFANGSQVALPEQIGIVQNGPSGSCLYWLHTHDASGLVHVESPPINAPYTLGQLFAIWGEPLGPNVVASFHGPVHAFLDGRRYAGDLAAIPLTAHAEITLEVGSPVVTPPVYTFPAAE